MSRVGDIAIEGIVGVGGIIGAAFAWDKYGNSGGIDNFAVLSQDSEKEDERINPDESYEK